MLKTQASKLSQLGLYPHVAKQFYPPPANCVLYLPGYPPSTTVLKDHSGQGNDGTITGATPVRLPSGQWVLNFDGVTGLVDCGASATLKPAAITVLCWARRADTGRWQFVLGDWEDADQNTYRLGFIGDGVNVDHLQWQIRIDAGTYATQNPHISDTNWHLIGGTYNGANVISYVDGSVSETIAIVGNITTGTNKLYIGQNPDGYKFAGDIGLPLILSSALTASEIAGIYNQGHHLFGV